MVTAVATTMAGRPGSGGGHQRMHSGSVCIRIRVRIRVRIRARVCMHAVAVMRGGDHRGDDQGW